jgi:tetratricopeptide (TPR) repeat protein
MAHRRLGLALFNLGRTREAMWEVRAAARFSDGLPEIERLTALASLHGLLREHNHAISEILEILRLEPGDQWARTNLMYQLQIAGQYDRAEQELRPRWPSPGNTSNWVWSNIHEFQGRGATALDSARANYRRYRDSTGLRVLRNARSQMANFSAVRLAYDSALFYAMPVGPSDQGSPVYVAVSQFARGQLNEAIATQQRRARAPKADGEQPEDSPRTATGSYTALATMLISGDRATASQLLDGVLADTGYRNRDPANRHIRPVIALAAVGRAADARRELAAIELASDADVLTARETSLEIANGAVSLAEHRPREAINVLTRATTTIDWGSFDACRVCALPWLGRAYEAVGRPDSAAIMYERYLSTGDPFRLFADAAWRAVVLRRLGVLHAQSGDTTRAVRRLSEFIDLWKSADAELQPEVEKARRRVIELRAAQTVPWRQSLRKGPP